MEVVAAGHANGGKPVTQAILDVAPARRRLTSADVRAALTFITRSDTKPVFYSSALTGGARVLFETERHSVLIQDMRPLADALALDREGFELRRHQTAVFDLYDDDAVERVYYPEIEALLRALTGARRVIVFDATRRSDAGAGARNRDGLRGPASRVHVDYTEKSGPQRVKDLLGEAEASRLAASGARIIQINVSRDRSRPGRALAARAADAASVRPEDLSRPTRVSLGSGRRDYHLAHHPAQRWYSRRAYAGRGAADQGLRQPHRRPRRSPAWRLELPDTPEGVPPRESIEVVARLVIIED